MKHNCAIYDDANAYALHADVHMCGGIFDLSPVVCVCMHVKNRFAYTHKRRVGTGDEG